MIGTDAVRGCATMSPGGAYFRKAGVEHDVINAGTAPLTFIEIELKQFPG